MNKDICSEMYNSVMQYVRQTHAEEIEKAYEYFWEEEYPEDFLSDRALEFGFVNFEDWLTCDYRPREGKGFIDRYIEVMKPEPESTRALEAMRDSFISLYEVLSSDGVLELKDIAIGDNVEIKDERLAGIPPGNIFAARIITLDGNHIMGRCVYPFANKKEAVLSSLESQFNRFVKHKDPKGTMEQFLREESYMFNTIWVSCLSA